MSIHWSLGSSHSESIVTHEPSNGSPISSVISMKKWRSTIKDGRLDAGGLCHDPHVRRVGRRAGLDRTGSGCVGAVASPRHYALGATTYEPSAHFALQFSHHERHHAALHDVSCVRVVSGAHLAFSATSVLVAVRRGDPRRHDLADAAREPVAGVNPTHPDVPLLRHCGEACATRHRGASVTRPSAGRLPRIVIKSI